MSKVFLLVAAAAAAAVVVVVGGGGGVVVVGGGGDFDGKKSIQFLDVAWNDWSSTYGLFQNQTRPISCVSIKTMQVI